MKRAMFLCRFDSTSDIKKPTYQKVKEQVLEAGRYSVFEATRSAEMAKLFTSLERDPELICTRVGFPWIKVERKQT